ncbi:tail fiber domain-containing protein [bacterium]|nr:tail fiber domain-containing protein [bacterium]
MLQTNGSGILSWVNGASSVAANSLDFDKLINAMTLDASTDIAASGTNVLSITNSGTGNSFVVNDQASDTTPFVIDPAGNVGIGTVSPSEKLHVVGNLRVRGSTDCTLGNGSGGTNCSSDIRLKTNVQEIKNPLEKILSLRGIEFDWNEKSQSPGDHAIGVIAQDVEKQFPTAVIEDSNTGYKKVDYAVLVAPVIQAFKELNKRITELFSVSESHSRRLASVEAENAAKDKEIAKLKADAEKQKRESDTKIKILEQRDAETKARLDKIEKMLKSK